MRAIDPARRLLGIPSSVVFLLALTGSFLACGPQTQIQKPSPQRTAAPQPQSEVLILPSGQKMQEDISYWTTENQRLVLAYFDIFLRHGLENATEARVVVAEDGSAADSLEFSLQNIGEAGGEEWWSYVPVAGRVSYRGRYPDYVLVFDGLRFRIRSGGGSRQTYDVPGSGKVVVDLEYVLWDNRKEEVAASGILHEESYTNSPSASSAVFKDLFEKMAERVVRDTPLT